MEQSLALIAERAAKSGKKKKPVKAAKAPKAAKPKIEKANGAEKKNGTSNPKQPQPKRSCQAAWEAPGKSQGKSKAKVPELAGE